MKNWIVFFKNKQKKQKQFCLYFLNLFCIHFTFTSVLCFFFFITLICTNVTLFIQETLTFLYKAFMIHRPRTTQCHWKFLYLQNCTTRWQQPKNVKFHSSVSVRLPETPPQEGVQEASWPHARATSTASSRHEGSFWSWTKAHVASVTVCLWWQKHKRDRWSTNCYLK